MHSGGSGSVAVTVESIPTGNVSTFFALERSQLLDRPNILKFCLCVVFCEQGDDHSILLPATPQQSENNQNQANLRQSVPVPYSMQALTPLSTDITLQGHTFLSFLSKDFRIDTTALNCFFPDSATRCGTERISALAAVSNGAGRQDPSQKIKATPASPLKKMPICFSAIMGEDWDKWYSSSCMTDQLEFTKD